LGESYYAGDSEDNHAGASTGADSYSVVICPEATEDFAGFGLGFGALELAVELREAAGAVFGALRDEALAPSVVAGEKGGLAAKGEAAARRAAGQARRDVAKLKDHSQQHDRDQFGVQAHGYPKLLPHIPGFLCLAAEALRGGSDGVQNSK
jgi:hypothetical protein